MIARIFFIVLSMVLSGHGGQGLAEENTIEKTQGIEAVYEKHISTETKKKNRRLPGKNTSVFLSEIRKPLPSVKEKTNPQIPLYVQHRSLLI